MGWGHHKVAEAFPGGHVWPPAHLGCGGGLWTETGLLETVVYILLKIIGEVYRHFL